jgi:ATP-dependent Clp protease ATP-binding subunit ClpA
MEQVLTMQDPVERLRSLRRLEQELELFETELVADAISAGSTWRAVGAAIGVSKQAAHRRHSDGVAQILSGAQLPDPTLVPSPPVVPDRVRMAIRLARREATAAGAAEVETGHLLLGILQVGDREVAAMLGDLTVNIERTRDVLARIRHHDDVPPDVTRVQQSERETSRRPSERETSRRPRPGVAGPRISGLARRSLERAVAQAKLRDPGTLTLTDLLRGVLAEKDGQASRALVALGADERRIDQQASGPSRKR